MSPAQWIKGHCPACGHQLLRRNPVTGQVECTHSGCSDPDALHKILAEDEREHIAMFDDRGFMTLRHPLRERLGDALMQCDVHEHVTYRGASYLPPGRYRVFVHYLEYDGIDVRFEPLDGHLALGPVEGDQDVYPGS